MVTSPVPQELRNRGVEGLSLRGEFGRWLKARERWLSAEDLYRTLKWKDDLYQEVMGHILEMLSAWGLVKAVDVRLGRKSS